MTKLIQMWENPQPAKVEEKEPKEKVEEKEPKEKIEEKAPEKKKQSFMTSFFSFSKK